MHQHLQRRADTQLNFQGFASLLVAGVTEVGAGVRLPDGGDDERAISNDVPVGAVQSCLVAVRLTVGPSASLTGTSTLLCYKYYCEGHPVVRLLKYSKHTSNWQKSFVLGSTTQRVSSFAFYAHKVDTENSSTKLFIKITDQTYSDKLRIYMLSYIRAVCADRVRTGALVRNVLQWEMF